LGNHLSIEPELPAVQPPLRAPEKPKRAGCSETASWATACGTQDGKVVNPNG